MPGGDPSARVPAGRLGEPWRTYATQAEASKRRFDEVVATVPGGPLRERLQQLSGRLDDGIQESWRIARRGHELDGAIGKIDTAGAQLELAELRRAIGDRPPSPAEADTAEALEAQLASAQRLGALADRSRDRLRLLDARFDELVARTVEVERRLRRHRRPRQRRRRPRHRAGDAPPRPRRDRPRRRLGHRVTVLTTTARPVLAAIRRQNRRAA